MYSYLIYKIGQFMAIYFPLPIAYLIAAILSSLQYLFSFKDRHCVRSNLKRIIPEVGKFKRELITWRVFMNFGHYLVDFLRLPKLNKIQITKKAKIINKHLLDRSIENGKGAILATGHIGNWELGGVITALDGYKLLAVALSHNEKDVNNLFNGLRAIGNVRVAQIKKAAFECMRSLKKNEFVAIVADRDFTNSGLIVDFFGKPTLMPKGPAIFALKTDALILPVFSFMRKNNTVELVINEPLKISKTEDFDADVRKITIQITKILEDTIKNNPEQWFMFRQFWLNNEELCNYPHA